MSMRSSSEFDPRDLAPGDELSAENDVARRVVGYVIGFVVVLGLTGVSFYVAGSDLIWKPGIAPGIIVLAIAQMGVHLVFFLHITTAPDSTNNVLALAFGVLIVLLVIGGSLWIITHLNHNMMPVETIMQMQR
jgi:cytochrome o ubiquinol oxidase operon protein cyoD